MAEDRKKKKGEKGEKGEKVFFTFAVVSWE